MTSAQANTFLEKNDGPAALRQPYLRVIHLEMSSPSSSGAGGSNPFGVQFSPEEEEEFGEMARSEGFYERFARSVGPSIYGSLGSLDILILSCLAHRKVRYQKGNYLSSLWRLKKGPS